MSEYLFIAAGLFVWILVRIAWRAGRRDGLRKALLLAVGRATDAQNARVLALRRGDVITGERKQCEWTGASSVERDILNLLYPGASK